LTSGLSAPVSVVASMWCSCSCSSNIEDTVRAALSR
jgi:hypothetical protein